MRLTTILLTAVLLSAYTPGASQQVTYSGEQVKLETIFKEVKKQTGYFIAYDLSLVEKAAPVTIKAVNQPLNSFMQELLKDRGLSFRIEANTIVITPAPLKPPVTALPELRIPSPQSISGKVVDSLEKPIQGASVKIAGTSTGTTTKADGSFRINNVEQGRYTLEISFVGYETMIKMVSVSHQDAEIGTLTLKQSSQQMDDVVVVNTGYQKLKPNEMVGAVEVITSEQLNINTGTTILDRLKNLSTALSFERLDNGRPTGPGNKLGITIRGLSTLNGPADPLIVLDDFIYEGDIENIDPNTIESVTILKDAVATSIWGPRAGNGVIVLTSKRAKRSSKPSISVSVATKIIPPPNLRKFPVVDTRTFLELEQQRGPVVGNTRPYTPYDPFLKIRSDRQKNLITVEDSIRLVNELAQVDFRDEYQKAFYRTGLQQAYNISLNHGTEIVRTNFSAGFSQTVSDLKATDKRLNLSFNNSLKLSKKLNLAQSISYNTTQTKSGAPAFRSVRANANARPLPYIRFYEPDGSPSSIGYDYNKNFLDTLGRGMLLDWKYYPAEDYKHNYQTDNGNFLNLNTNLDYAINKRINLQLAYGFQQQNGLARDVLDIQSYRARNIINSPAILNYTLGTVEFPIPVGDIITNNWQKTTAHNGRASIHYTYRYNKHAFNGMAGIEARAVLNTSSQDKVFGYNEDPLYFQPVFSLTTGKHIVTGRTTDFSNHLDLEKPRALEERGVAAFFNLNYTFDDRMSLFMSYRRDGTNIFGMEKKDKWKPFWSVGSMIKLNDYLPKLRWLDQLHINATLGISGNMDVTATSEAIASTILAPYNTAVAAEIKNVNNPYLSWERVKQVDIGLYFGVFNKLISGSINVYAKRGSDLYGPEPFDYTNFYTATIINNTSRMSGNGIDVNLQVHPRIRELYMTFGLNFSRHYDKITHYNSDNFFVAAEGLQKLEGISPNAVFVYDFKGLNHEGEPLFAYDGKTTTDALLVMSEFNELGLKASSIKYLGSRVPVLSTTINTAFRFRDFSLQFNLNYAGKFYTQYKNFFNYSDFNSWGLVHESYYRRWQKPGDELHTNIPKISFPLSNWGYGLALHNSNFAYRRGDHIALSVVNFAWNFRMRNLTSGTIGVRLNDIGVIWSMEKDYKYREFPNYTLRPVSYAFDIRLNF